MGTGSQRSPECRTTDFSQDAWIAATALRHDLPLATHNIKDFVGISNLRLITPPP